MKHQAAWLSCVLLVLGCGGDGGKKKVTDDLSDDGPVDACATIPQGRVVLPQDDAAHDEDTEWWYWTGHLEAADGRRFGFEHVFFVQKTAYGLGMMAHHAITDHAAGTFQYDVGYTFGAPPSTANGFDLTVNAHTAVGGGGNDTLHGQVGDYVLDLTVEATKAPVLQHGDGYTDYGVGGFTYYYSRPRMRATGTLQLGGESLAVSGTAWFDHQWGALGNAIETGWDWFSIQLDDEREIMLFIVRPPEGNVLVGGTYVDSECAVTEIAPDAFEVTSHGEWTSPQSGCTYPVGWTVTVQGLTLTVTPVLEAQEIETHFLDYWEGAAEVTGDATGKAYVELTGYCAQ